MIWQLFCTHIVLASIILLLFLSWLFWPCKHKSIRKGLIRTCGITLLGSILLALYTYWPRAYDKKYLDNTLSVELEQTPIKQLADSIEFYIGMATSPDSPYEELIVTEFNSIVAENHFKPGQLLVDAANWKFDFSKADQLMDHAEVNGLRMRGHTLIWGKFAGMTFPKQWIDVIDAAEDPKTTMKGLIKRYIETVMGHYQGRVMSWDVVNEPMGGEDLFPSIFSNSMGEEYIDYAFQIAREVDPACSLFLNEQIIDYQGPKGQAFLGLLKRLLDRGVPIDGVGLQCHHLNDIHDIDALKGYIRSIGAMGLNVEITELDVRLLLFRGKEDPYQAQGDQFRNVVKVCLDDPACKGVTLWGVSDGANWMDAVPPFQWKSPNAPNIWDEDMRKKPGYVGIWKALHDAQAQ